MNFSKLILGLLVGLLALIYSADRAYAAGFGGGGEHSLGAGLIFLSPDQEDTNTLIERSNARVGISTRNLSTAYELYGFYMYRFSGTMFALQLRPSYFTQSSKGSGPDGDYDYSLTGWTVFPILRLYPLENTFMRFFLQTGIGYGRLNGEITEGAAKVEFSGGNFGALAGLGADFCFTESHCVTIEGNYRYLPIERNIGNGGNGTAFQSGSVTQTDGEVELGQSAASAQDLKTTMSGVQGVIAYKFTF